MGGIVKSILGGIVARNVKMQVFIDPKTYLELITEAKHWGIKIKNDSGLINNLIHIFLEQYPLDKITIEQQRRALEDKNKKIAELESVINEQLQRKDKAKPRQKKSN